MRLTVQHWEAIQDWCSKHPLDSTSSEENRMSTDGLPGEQSGTQQAPTANDFGQLLAVATLYVDSFKEDELMSLPEKLRLQEVEAILERHGRRY